MNRRVALYDRLPLLAPDRWWFAQAQAAPGRRVLEFGAASGRLTLGFAAAGMEVTAVERDPDMTERLEQRTAALADRVQVVHADAADLGDGEVAASFGLVCLPSSLLNEVDDLATRRRVVSAARRCCHPDGLVALQILGPWWLAGLPSRSSGQLQPADGGPSIEVTIEAFGFDPERGRRQAELTYRFPDGTVLRDDLDAGVITPAELDLLLDEADLDLVDRSGAVPPAPVHVDDPVWHVIARPRPAVA